MSWRLLQTASTLTFAVYMLAEHPKILVKLRDEIIRKVGTTRQPTYEDFRDMKYLRAVLNGTHELSSDELDSDLTSMQRPFDYTLPCTYCLQVYHPMLISMAALREVLTMLGKISRYTSECLSLIFFGG